MANSNTDDVLEMTKEAYEELQTELEQRKTKLREEIANEIAEARELGDLSENHAYSTAMEKKDLNENRITDLEAMLKSAKVVSSSKKSKVARIGRTIEILNKKTNKSRVITLVGSEETQSADPTSGKVSIDSPIGSAVLNSKVGDEVDVELPAGKITFKIVKFVD